MKSGLITILPGWTGGQAGLHLDIIIRWILNEAIRISGAGNRITGWGTNQESACMAWLLTGCPLEDREFAPG